MSKTKLINESEIRIKRSLITKILVATRKSWKLLAVLPTFRYFEFLSRSFWIHIQFSIPIRLTKAICLHRWLSFSVKVSNLGWAGTRNFTCLSYDFFCKITLRRNINVGRVLPPQRNNNMTTKRLRSVTRKFLCDTGNRTPQATYLPPHHQISPF